MKPEEYNLLQNISRKLDYFYDEYYRTHFPDKTITRQKSFFEDELNVKGQFAIKEYDNGSATSTATINWANGNDQYITLTGNTTLTFVNPKPGAHYTLHIAGAYTPTFPSTVRWTAGTTPTATATSGKKDIYVFIYSGKESLYDGLQSANYSIT